VTSDFSLLQNVPNACGVHPVPYFMGTEVFSSGIKRLGREVDKQPPANAEIKHVCNYSFTLTTPLHGRDIHFTIFKYDKVVLD
jgi:hypothetical protein